jgi:orotate phosphoribosyltransferase
MKERSVRIAPEGEPFTLASGEKSDVYIDVKKSSMHHSIQRTLAYVLHQHVLQLVGVSQFDAVAGVALGGCHLASLVGFQAALEDLPLDVLHVRKEAKDHGTKNLIEGPAPVEGRLNRVVLVEDVVTTGGSSIKAIRALEDSNQYLVVGIVTVVERRYPNLDVPLKDTERGRIYRVLSLFHITDLSR